MIATPLSRLRRLVRHCLDVVGVRVARWTRPAPLVVAAAVADVTRSRSELLLENALLRHQLVV